MSLFRDSLPVPPFCKSFFRFALDFSLAQGAICRQLRLSTRFSMPSEDTSSVLVIVFMRLARGSQNGVAIEIGTEQQANELIALTQERMAQAAALRSGCADWLGIFGGGTLVSDVYQDDPCTRIVYNWLESDFREVDWDH